MRIERFEDIEAWKESRRLVKSIYHITNQKSFTSDGNLSRQIQAAAVSVMSNIAEGFSRRTKKDFARFLDMALSSATEVQSDLYVALDQQYLSESDFNEIYNQCQTVKKLIGGFLRYLRSVGD